MSLPSLLALFASLALPLVGGPLLLGLVQRTKAIVAGRRGPPLLQPWRDVVKLLRKGAVLSDASTGLLVLGPAAFLATASWAGSLVPLGAGPAPLAFAGDLFLFAGLLATGRFLLAAAAMDVGSSFEGMGASRDLGFAALAEPVLLLALAAVAVAAGGASLSSLPAVAAVPVPSVVLALLALYVVLLAENARVPFDDPATHLELTMVHEVMVLDHGGVDLAFVQWGSAVKLFVFAQVLVAPIAALAPPGAAALLLHVALVLAVGVVVGLTESVTARLRLVRVPHLLFTGLMLAAFAAAIAFLRRGT